MPSHSRRLEPLFRDRPGMHRGFEAHRGWPGLEFDRGAWVCAASASAGHENVVTQSIGINERLIAGGMPASDQVPHNRSPVRLVGLRKHMQVRRGMVSRALSLGMRCQEFSESRGLADTDRNPAIVTSVAPREDINPALIANRFFEWLCHKRIHCARPPGPNDRVTHGSPSQGRRSNDPFRTSTSGASRS